MIWPFKRKSEMVEIRPGTLPVESKAVAEREVKIALAVEKLGDKWIIATPINGRLLPKEKK